MHSGQLGNQENETVMKLKYRRCMTVLIIKVVLIGCTVYSNIFMFMCFELFVRWHVALLIFLDILLSLALPMTDIPSQSIVYVATQLKSRPRGYPKLHEKGGISLIEKPLKYSLNDFSILFRCPSKMLHTLLICLCLCLLLKM